MAKARRYDPKIVPVTRTLGVLLYLFVLPPLIAIVFALMKLDIKAFVLNFGAFLLYALALYFSRKGFEQEFEYKLADFAKAPKIPYKLIGAFTLAVAVLYASFLFGGYSLFESLFLAFVALVGYYLWYGFDPNKDKIPDTGDVGVDVALETLEEAKAKIAQSEELLDRVKNSELRAKVRESLEIAKEVVDELERKPAFIRELRRFLVVFLDSVYETTASYVKVEETLKPAKKEALLHLMDEVQERFQKELQRVKSKGEFDFEVKMETLSHQIKS